MESTHEKILDRLQRFFKTDIRKLLQGGFWLSVGQFFSSASSFIVAVIFANILSKDTYGDYRYALSLFALLLIPTLTSMDTAVTRTLAQGNEAVFKPAFFEKLRWGIIGTIASFGVAYYYYIHRNTLFALSFASVALFIPLIESLDMYNAILQARLAFRQFTLYNSLTQILSALVSIIVALQFNNVFALTLAYVVSNTLLNGLFLWLSVKNKPLNTLGTQQEIKETLNYGKHLSFLDIFYNAVGQLDKILVYHYLGGADLAIYSLAIAPPEQMKGLLKNIQYMAMPRFAQRTKEEIQQTLLPRLVKFGLIILLFVLAYIVAAPFVFKIFFHQYPEAVLYSQIFSFSLIAGALASVPYSFLQAHKAQKALYRYSLWTNVATIAILFPCIYYWHLMGAIVARLIIRFVVLFIALILAYTF